MIESTDMCLWWWHAFQVGELERDDLYLPQNCHAWMNSFPAFSLDMWKELVRCSANLWPHPVMKPMMIKDLSTLWRAGVKKFWFPSSEAIARIYSWKQALTCEFLQWTIDLWVYSSRSNEMQTFGASLIRDISVMWQTMLPVRLSAVAWVMASVLNENNSVILDLSGIK